MTVTPFSIVPTTVLTDNRLTLAEHRVLGALFSFRSSAQDFTVWPSRERIGERCGIASVAHVSRILGRLTKKGWIEDITRRRGSSVYRLSPGPTCAHRAAQVHVHTGQHIDQTKDTRTEDPLTPSGGEEGHIEILAQSVAAELPVIVEEIPADVPETDVIVASLPTAPEPHQDRQERIEAAVRVVAHLNATAGAQLDTRAHSATVKRAARRLRHHSEQDLVEVIEAKGREFRHPAALLKPSVVEAILSERRQRAAAEQRRRQREVETLAQVRPVAVNAEAARAGVRAMRAALGVRSALNSG